jgi:Na+/H+-dicarboxylate symporter
MKIYNNIFIGLLLGVIFGILFPVRENLLRISYKEANKLKTADITNWVIIKIIHNNIVKEFKEGESAELIAYYDKIDADNEVSLKVLHKDKKEEGYIGVVELAKHTSLPLYLKPIGTLFVRLLSFIAIPLVVASLFVGACSIGDIKKVADIGYKILIYYILTTVIAVSIGLGMANTIKPGYRISEESRKLLMQGNELEVKVLEGKLSKWSVSDFFLRIVPANPFSALASGEMLPIIFTAIFIGLVANYINKEKSKILISFFDALASVMIECVNVVMKIAPYAVFILIGAVISEFGYGIVRTLFWYILTVIIGLLVHLFLVYPILLKVFAKVSVKDFYKSMRPAMLIAFSTSSSAATLPISMECCEKGLKIPQRIISFVLPLGATINMDGTALYQGVAAVFIAQLYHQDLIFSQQLTILMTAVMASIGTAPVPGVGIIMLMIILKSIGVPEEGIVIILGVDRLLDMCRTVVNISGDAVGASIISRFDRKR